MPPTVEHVINNWAAATELRLPPCTLHTPTEGISHLSSFSNVLWFDKLLDAQEWLRLTHRAAQENGKGSEWLFLILVRRNSGLRPLSSVWWALDRPGVTAFSPRSNICTTTYPIYMYCYTLILFLFIVKTELKLNWRLNFAGMLWKDIK